MWRELLGLERKANGLLELITPRRSFNDVVLPAETRQELYEALTQIEKHRLIFSNWGLGERHPTGDGLVFNFAGPPGTGKTICAEAVAYTLGRKLLRVSYAELESCWAGETGKNIRQVFREARTADAVLFFDEADSVATRRFSNVAGGYEREANQTVNILLKEVEEHDGVIIFATNLASNFDPAFERRIRTHILFRIPSAAERERIWKVQVHPDKTPLGEDVDFRALAQQYELTGGNIRNAVLKAAQIAAAEEGPDERKRIHQRHFQLAVSQVMSARQVMQQNAVDPAAAEPIQEAMELAERRFSLLDEDINACRTELGILSESQEEIRSALGERVSGLHQRLDQLGSAGQATREDVATLRTTVETLRSELQHEAEHNRTSLKRWHGEQGELVKQLAARLEAQERQLAGVTLLPWPKGTAAALGAMVAIVLLLAGGVAGHFLVP
jgi:MoxR-like ATPase